MVVPLALESGELCTGQVILQPIPLKSDRLLDACYCADCIFHFYFISALIYWAGKKIRHSREGGNPASLSAKSLG